MKKNKLTEKYSLYDEDKTAYGENRSVVQKCKEFLREANSDILDGSNADLPNNVVEIFKRFGGDCRISELRPQSFRYEGWLPNPSKAFNSDRWTIGGTFIQQYLYGDANRLAEDLTMWYYRNQLNGKKIPNTPALNRIMNNISDIDWTSNVQEEGLSVGSVTNSLGSFNKSNTMIGTPNRKGSPLHRQSRKGSNPKK